MIDKVNGSIILDNGNIINNNMTIESFMEDTTLYKGEGVRQCYTLKDSHYIDGKGFLITLYFDNGKLKEVHLSEVIVGLSWNDWTEDIEFDKKRSHDNWLLSILGKGPYRFLWGQIESVFDKKGCLSSIIVRYS